MTDPKVRVEIVNCKGGMLCNKLAKASRRRMKRTAWKAIRQDARQRADTE